MAQFNFWGTHSDWRGLIAAVLSFEGSYLLPYQQYTTKSPTVITDPDEALACTSRMVRMFYVGSTAFTKAGPLMKPVAYKGMPRKFRIVANAPGPFCSIRLPGAFEVRKVLHLNPGDWFRPPNYWSFREDFSAIAPVKPSEEVQEGYEQIKKRIASSLQRLDIQGRKVRIGQDALRSIMERGARIHVSGGWHHLSDTLEMQPVNDDISAEVRRRVRQKAGLA